MTAKAVYIDNHTGTQKVADQAYQELRRWGRFQVVLDHSHADLLLRFEGYGNHWLLLATDPYTGSVLWSGHRRYIAVLLSDFRERVEEQSKR